MDAESEFRNFSVSDIASWLESHDLQSLKETSEGKMSIKNAIIEVYRESEPMPCRNCRRRCVESDTLEIFRSLAYNYSNMTARQLSLEMSRSQMMIWPAPVFD